MSVHLNSGDSVSLTTGRVTRTTDTRGDWMLLRNASARERILGDSVRRVTIKNDLNALAYVIRNGA